MSTTSMQLLKSAWEWLWSLVYSVWIRFTARTIDFGGNLQVRVGHQIAEGGFSYVFLAWDSSNSSSGTSHRPQRRTYALKRVHCSADNPELRQQCQAEARVHRAVQHGNCMPLLGLKFVVDQNYCFMLFPYYEQSLRKEINRRIFDRPQHQHSPDAPWSPTAVLQLVHGIASGLQALHEAGYSHRDLKPENVLLQSSSSMGSNTIINNSNNTGGSLGLEPVLMDFGSAGALTQSLISRRDVMMAVETAATHTTMPYRPPELIEAGGLRHGDPDLDYAAVDVWSLGCLVFAILYGTSPTECEFQRDGSIRVIPCTQLSILKDVPTPPPSAPTVAAWYPPELGQLVKDCLNHDRALRPSVPSLLVRLEELLQLWGGSIPMARANSMASSHNSRFRDSFDEDDDLVIRNHSHPDGDEDHVALV